MEHKHTVTPKGGGLKKTAQKQAKIEINFIKLCLMMQEDAECLFIKLWRHWESYCKFFRSKK